MSRSFVLGISLTLLSITGTAFADTQIVKAIAGDWRLPQGTDVISIEEGGKWLHPKHGPAQLREANDNADLRVFYSSGGARCSYRVSLSDQGKTLVLIAADPLQDPEYCPEGSLKRVDSAQDTKQAAASRPSANSQNEADSSDK